MSLSNLILIEKFLFCILIKKILDSINKMVISNHFIVTANCIELEFELSERCYQLFEIWRALLLVGLIELVAQNLSRVIAITIIVILLHLI